MVVELSGICEFRLFYVAYLVILLALEAQEYVVFVCVQIVLTILENVVFVAHLNGVDGELVGVLLLFLERVFHLAHIFELFVLYSVCCIELPEQVGVQIGRCHCSRAQTIALQLVVADGGVHRAIEYGRFVLSDRYPACEEECQSLFHPIVYRVVAQFAHHLINRLLLLAHLGYAVFCPILLRTAGRAVVLHNAAREVQHHIRKAVFYK